MEWGDGVGGWSGSHAQPTSRGGRGLRLSMLHVQMALSVPRTSPIARGTAVPATKTSHLSAQMSAGRCEGWRSGAMEWGVERGDGVG